MNLADDSSAPAVSGQAAAASRWLKGFTAGHGKSVATIQYLGRGRTRIVVIAADGGFGDAVVESVDLAQQVCSQAGIEVVQWDRETTSRLSVSPADRRKMAGTGR